MPAFVRQYLFNTNAVLCYNTVIQIQISGADITVSSTLWWSTEEIKTCLLCQILRIISEPLKLRLATLNYIRYKKGLFNFWLKLMFVDLQRASWSGKVLTFRYLTINSSLIPRSLPHFNIVCTIRGVETTKKWGGGIQAQLQLARLGLNIIS